jgi:hypothetical protein
MQAKTYIICKIIFNYYNYKILFIIKGILYNLINNKLD